MHDALHRLLLDVAAGAVTPDAALERLRDLPAESLGFATIDHHRALRTGLPEVVYGAGKTPDQIAAIVEAQRAQAHPVLVTRLDANAYAAASDRLDPDGVCRWEPTGRTWAWCPAPPEPTGRVAVVCAGTSDLPVAMEAIRALQVFGDRVDCVHDVGVAGLHRLLPHLPALRQARVVVVVAGMDGALPSVLGGLLACPVIAAPTSVGYGASFGGLAALLAMLNSCAPGVAVVNIDNGFGAACAAHRINRMASA